MRFSFSWIHYVSVVTLLLVPTVLWISPVNADSIRADCGLSDTAEQRPETSSSCMFSQRQGYIHIAIDGGDTYSFSPTGGLPGNYHDDEGRAIYRQRGLGDEGQLFKLPATYLFVFWSPSSWDCSQEELNTAGGCDLNYGGISFNVHASQGSSLTQLQINTRGLTSSGASQQAELDGTAYRAELADLDGNGWPEIYVYVSSAGSGSYGSLAAYAVNSGKSLSSIYLPPMDQSPEVNEGYMGHDEFSVVENRLVRRFPVYKAEDTNAQPTGGTRQLQYRLEAGEAGWILQLDRVVEFQ